MLADPIRRKNKKREHVKGKGKDTKWKLKGGKQKEWSM
jgi:hypothetical protein